MFKYEDMVSALQKGACEVKFTKVDGSERTMVCTLKSSMLPEEYRAEVRSTLTEGDGSHEVVNVWDVSVNGWRSFRVSAVQSFSYVQKETA